VFIGFLLFSFVFFVLFLNDRAQGGILAALNHCRSSHLAGCGTAS